jgi:hypothetical protein
MARPPKYSDDTKPASVSLRIPRDVYDQVQHLARMRNTTLTELIVEGLRLRLETPVDPRDILVSQDNTVMQELQEMIDARIAVALAAHLPHHPEPVQVQPVPAMAHDDNITVMQESDSFMGTIPHYENTVLQEKALAYDTSKYVLGKMCTNKHNYQGTGQSLRRIKGNECLQCQVERKRKSRKEQQSSE